MKKKRFKLTLFMIWVLILLLWLSGLYLLKTTLFAFSNSSKAHFNTYVTGVNIITYPN